MQLLQNTVPRPVIGVSFAREGAILVAGGSGGYDVWNLLESTHSFIKSHKAKYLFGCVCDPLGRWVYVSDHMHGLQLRGVDGQDRPIPGSADERHAPSFALTVDGKRLVLSRGGAGMNRVECWKVEGSGKLASVWSLLDGKPIPPYEPYLFNQATWFTNGVAISPDGKLVASAENRARNSSGDAPLIVLRDAKNGGVKAELGLSTTGFATRLSMSANNRSLYVWDNCVLERWDIKTGRLAQSVPAAGRAYFRGLAVHPSGKFLVTVSGDGQARYWDAVELAPMKSLKFAIGKLHAVAVSANGMLAAAGGDKGQVMVWDVDV